MVYVLIVIALFAALSFVLARNTDTSEADTTADAKVEVYAGQILQAPMQIKQALDQMVFTGANPNLLDFTEPGQPGFENQPLVKKVFHPEGGGVTIPRLVPEAVKQDNTDPAPRWYIGRFTDFEWTDTPSDDVVMTAHQISQKICAYINEKLTGSAAIPQLTLPARQLLIDHSFSSAGSNVRFTSAECPDCYGRPALCVQDNAVDAWSFYSILVPQ